MPSSMVVKCFLVIVVLTTMVQSQVKWEGELTRDKPGKGGSGGKLSILKEPKYLHRLFIKPEPPMEKKLDKVFQKQVKDHNRRPGADSYHISSEVHKPMTNGELKQKLKPPEPTKKPRYRPLPKRRTAKAAADAVQDWYAYDDSAYEEKGHETDELDALLTEMFMAGYEKGLQHGHRRN